MPLFESYAVGVVLTGHDHLYERAWPLTEGQRSDRGIVHIVSGGGGAELYSVGRSDWTVVAESVNHFCRIMISGSRLDLDVVGARGEEIDVLTIYKSDDVIDRLKTQLQAGEPRQQLESGRELGRRVC